MERLLAKADTTPPCDLLMLLSSKLSFMVSQTFFWAESKRLSNLANNALCLKEVVVQIEEEISLEILSFA